tara:strand:- start:3903 stop:4064 length:162 start_codon:yes stop_codon:yes gene_type:complete
MANYSLLHKKKAPNKDATSFKKNFFSFFLQDFIHVRNILQEMYDDYKFLASIL